MNTGIPTKTRRKPRPPRPRNPEVLKGQRDGVLKEPDGEHRGAHVERIRNRFGRGTVTVASALKTKAYLEHDRIPFGRPTDLR